MHQHNDRRQPPPAKQAVDHTGVLLTAADIERRITLLSDQMEELTYDLAKRAEVAALAEATYKVAFAKARLRARMQPGTGPRERTTNDEADDRAIRDCEEELTEHLITEALYNSARDALFSKRSQMDALRTIAANIRAST